MAILNNVTTGDSANSSCIQQLIDACKGTVGAGNIPISFTAINDSVNFALSVGNLEAVNGRAFHAVDSSGGTLIQADINGVALKNITGGLTITTGGLTVTAGGLTVSASGATITGGLTVVTAGLTVTAGGATVTAGNVGIGTAAQSGATSAGLTVASITSGATNNYGVYINVPSGGATTNEALHVVGRSNLGGGTNGGVILDNAGNSPPTVAANQIGLSSAIANTASAGGGQAVPGTVVGYWIVNVGGTSVKIPYFAT